MSQDTCHVQDHIRDEAALKESNQGTASQKAASTLEPKLRGSDNAPKDHLGGNPSVRADLLADELGR